MVPLISGHTRLSPFLSSSRPLFLPLSAPSLSLCRSFALFLFPLLFYPSIHLSRSLGRPAQLTCLNSHLSIPSIPVWLCEREPVHRARIPVPGPHPLPSPASPTSHSSLSSSLSSSSPHTSSCPVLSEPDCRGD